MSVVIVAVSMLDTRGCCVGKSLYECKFEVSWHENVLSSYKGPNTRMSYDVALIIVNYQCTADLK